MLQQCQQIRVIPFYSAQIVLPFVSIVSSFSPFHQHKNTNFQFTWSMIARAYLRIHKHTHTHTSNGTCYDVRFFLSFFKSRFSVFQIRFAFAFNTLKWAHWQMTLQLALKLCEEARFIRPYENCARAIWVDFFCFRLSRVATISCCCLLELLVNFWALAQDRTNESITEKWIEKWRNKKRISVWRFFYEIEIG